MSDIPPQPAPEPPEEPVHPTPMPEELRKSGARE